MTSVGASVGVTQELRRARAAVAAVFFVSVDPARDTPEKLKQYGIGYLGKDSKATDFKVWQIAVGADDVFALVGKYKKN